MELINIDFTTSNYINYFMTTSFPSSSYLSTRPSIHLFIHPSIHQPDHPSNHSSHPPIHPFIHPSISISIYHSQSLSKHFLSLFLLLSLKSFHRIGMNCQKSCKDLIDVLHVSHFTWPPSKDNRRPTERYMAIQGNTKQYRAIYDNAEIYKTTQSNIQ